MMNKRNRLIKDNFIVGITFNTPMYILYYITVVVIYFVSHQQGTSHFAGALILGETFRKNVN